MRRAVARGMACAASALALAAYGCATDDAPAASPGIDAGQEASPDDAPSPELCPAGSGSGTLALTIEGLPDAGMPNISFQAADGFRPSIAGSTTLAVHAGLLGVDVQDVTVDDAVVATTFVHETVTPTLCIRDHETTSLTVRYARVPTSGTLWLGAAAEPDGGPDGAVLTGYAAASLRATGAATSAVDAFAAGAGGIAFDDAGNMWRAGIVAGEPAIARFPTNALAKSGSASPDIVLTSDAFEGGAPEGIAWAGRSGPNGKLDSVVVTVPSRSKVLRLSVDVAPGAHRVTPEDETDDTGGARGIAVGPDGNMWLAATGASRLYLYASSFHPGPRQASIELSSPGSGGAALPPPVGLAVDSHRALWVNCGAALVRVDAPNTAAGDVALPVTVRITPIAPSPAASLAFDASGSLWTAGADGTVVAYAKSQLAATATVTPAVTVTPASPSAASWFAFHPHATGLPLPPTPPLADP